MGNSEPSTVLELGRVNTLGRSICVGFTEVGDSRDAGRRGEQLEPWMSEGQAYEVKANGCRRLHLGLGEMTCLRPHSSDS